MTTEQPKRERTLDTAKSLVSGQRAKDYGDARESFTRIGAGWALILGTPVSPGQAALMLAWLKMSRLSETITHEDSWIDLAGYAALGSEVTSNPIVEKMIEDLDEIDRKATRCLATISDEDGRHGCCLIVGHKGSHADRRGSNFWYDNAPGSRSHDHNLKDREASK